MIRNYFRGSAVRANIQVAYSALPTSTEIIPFKFNDSLNFIVFVGALFNSIYFYIGVNLWALETTLTTLFFFGAHFSIYAIILSKKLKIKVITPPIIY